MAKETLSITFKNALIDLEKRVIIEHDSKGIAVGEHKIDEILPRLDGKYLGITVKEDIEF